MKTNKLQHLMNLFPKQMDVETYKKQLQSFWLEYKNWWFKPLEGFRKEYQEKHGSIFNSDYRSALENFEYELRTNDDLLTRFYDFMDENYTVYIKATPKEQAEIRTLIEKQSDIDYYFEDLLRKYVRDHIVQQIKLTGKRIWLLRGLVAMSMENSSVDYRDTLTSLAELYAVAEENGINPKKDWDRISGISGDEIPRGGTTPMKKLMAGIYSSAILREQKSQRK